MHPFLQKHPQLYKACNLFAGTLLLTLVFIGIADFVENWRVIANSPYGFFLAFNYKHGIITNHVASIVAIGAVALYFFLRSTRIHPPLIGVLWIGLIIGVHETLWWITHLFFLDGQNWMLYAIYGPLNYPMAMFVLYVLVNGWGQRETLFLGLMGAYYVMWALIGFHVTADFTGFTPWVTSLSVNLTESLSWIYACAWGAVCASI